MKKIIISVISTIIACFFIIFITSSLELIKIEYMPKENQKKLEVGTLENTFQNIDERANEILYDEEWYLKDESKENIDANGDGTIEEVRIGHYASDTNPWDRYIMRFGKCNVPMVFIEYESMSTLNIAGETFLIIKENCQSDQIYHILCKYEEMDEVANLIILGKFPAARKPITHDFFEVEDNILTVGIASPYTPMESIKKYRLENDRLLLISSEEINYDTMQ